MKLALASLRRSEALGRNVHWADHLGRAKLRLSRGGRAISGSDGTSPCQSSPVARKSRQPSASRDFRTSGFTLIELSITIAVILILVGAASLGIKPYYAYRDGRQAGEMLRSVKAAQLMYLSDYPSAAVTSLNHTAGATGDITPYMPNGAWPTLPKINGVQPTIDCTQFPPVAVLSGATYPAVSPAPTDGLWNVGLY